MSGGDDRAAAVERLLAARLARRKDRPMPAPAAGSPSRPPATAVTGRGPLSFTQERLWFLDRIGNLGPAYTVGLLLGLTGRLDVSALRAALAEIIRRHGTLRTHIATEEGRPVQVVAPPAPLFLPVVDLEGIAEAAAPSGVAQALTTRWLRRGFQLDRGPLIRPLLLRLGPAAHRILLPVHHIVSDGWSASILLRELSTLYPACLAGEPSPLPEPPRQFFELAREERDSMQGERLGQELEFWRRELAGVPELIELPTDRPRPSVLGYDGATTRWRPAAGLGEALEAQARARRATPFMVLLAAYAAVLSRWSGQRDLAIGSPIANRMGLDAEPLIGYFANTLVMRARLDGDPTFDGLVERVRSTALAAYPHQALPFEKLVSELNPQRSLSHNPVFQVMLTLQSTPLERPRLPDLEVDLLPGSVGTTQVDLEVQARLVKGTLFGQAVFSTELYDTTTVRRLLGHLENFLNAAFAAPATPVAALPMASPAERAQMLVEWNDTDRRLPHTGAEASLHGLVQRQIEARPEAVAVVFRDGFLTYGELGRRSRRLAARLVALGVGPDQLVGVAAERSLELSVGLLAILEAGAAYVPIDPSYPRDRQQMMVEDSGVRVILSQSWLVPRLPLAPGEGVTVISLDRPDEVDGEPVPMLPAPALPAVGGDHLAYMIFTSGSTGRPKGAMNSHRSILNMLQWLQVSYCLKPRDRVLQRTAISFDVSVWELFWPHAQGAALVMAEPGLQGDSAYLARLMAQERVTTVHFVPSQLQVFLTEPRMEGLGCLSRVVVSGEALSWDLAQRFWSRFRHEVRLIDLYGPTEAAVDVSFWNVPRSASRQAVPIGRPMANTRIYVVDRHLRALPMGVAGEAMLGGVNLARGYWNRPSLTAERFLPDPFSPVPGSRMYRSGDLCRFWPSGEIDFLGRLDHQVKIRGFRVELGEIEAALASHPAVREVVVMARTDLGRGGADDQRLVAYLVGHTGPVAADELRAFLRERLPEHMVPSFFVSMPAFPLNPSGKTDRKQLPRPGEEPARPAAAPPRRRESLLDRLERIWADVLGVSGVAREASFFDVGGHSLLLVEVQRQIEEQLGESLSLVDLFQHPTLAGLAAFLGERLGEAPGAPAAEAPAPVRPEVGAIAVIGLAGRFPGAGSVEELWRLLVEGRRGIRVFSREELLAQGLSERVVDDPRFVPARGWLEGAERFDAAFFGTSPREAEMMDPQQRLFLETAWTALEDAGYDPRAVPGRVGLFAGAGMNTYLLNLLSHPERIAEVGFYQTSIGNKNDYLTTRVSYKLGLAGPSVNVQTACSTSLVAVHLACRALAAGECEMALAGGAAVSGFRSGGYRYEPGAIVSPDGHCRPFDHRAQGTVGGDGVGVVVLKPLVRALADGDPVRAVILGSAINNDGADKVGFTAPSVEGQAAAIAGALAGLDPATISYVEAHGTATELGDPIEVAALRLAWERAAAAHGSVLPAAGSVAIGSIKSNVGHLDAAAGVTGLIKAVLALEREEIPATLHFERENPRLELGRTPFRVQAERSAWPRGEGPRRAAVSSFGIGGTNAHAVLEEAPALGEAAPSRPWQLLVLSARSPSAADAALARLADRLDSPAAPLASLADVAYTLAVGRRGFGHRRAVVARDVAEAVRRLRGEEPEQLLGGSLPEGVVGGRPVAFLFPGQGAQYAGMAEGLYTSEPVFRAAVDECLEGLGPGLGPRLRELLFPAAAEREEAQRRLARTAFTQPALFTVEWALARLWASWGVEPAQMIGHSVGELVAACLAGVFPLAEALRLVALRGKLMDDLPAGEMLALSLSEEEAQALLPAEVELAAVNAPRSLVVSGPREAIAELAASLAGSEAAPRRLETSHAFHSRAMEPMLADFAEAVRRADPQPPRKPYVSSRTGTWVTVEEATSPELWAEQLRRPVRFAAGLGELLSLTPAPVLLEVGPGRTLATFARQHPARRPEHAVVTSLRHPQAEEADVAFLLGALGRLWLAGAAVDLSAVWKGEARRRVSLPGYPFEGKRHWVSTRPGFYTPGERPVDALTAEAQGAGDETAAETERAAPSTPLEQAVAEVMASLLGVASPGRHDDFFELGGSSLLAVRFAARLKERLGREVSPHLLLAAPTVARIAGQLEGEPEVRPANPAGEGDERISSLLVEIQAGQHSRPPLFCIHPAGGHVYAFRDLTRALGRDQPVLGLRARGLEEGEEPASSIEEMADLYEGEVLARWPAGPLLLAGHSMGGMVAWELARRFEARGRQVALLALIDTFGPGQLPSFDPASLESRSADASEAARRQHRVQRLCAEAMFAYQPPAYGGRVLFFRARERRAGEPSHPERAWIDLAEGGVEVRIVHGDHDAVLRDPQVLAIASRVSIEAKALHWR